MEDRSNCLYSYFTTFIGMPVKPHTKSRLSPREIAHRIREIRGFDSTQAEFAKKLGMGQQQLSALETGRSSPTLEVLVKLADISGKSLDWIVFGKDE
jgi:DNA-binding XRE family transcriptional regulator